MFDQVAKGNNFIKGIRLNDESENLEEADQSYLSETGEQIRERIKQAKLDFEMHGIPMPMFTAEQQRKLMECIKPTDDFFEHFQTGKLLGQGSICEGVY